MVGQVLEVGVLRVVVGRIGVCPGQDVGRREDERVVGGLGVDRLDGLRRAVDRRDVLDREGQASRDVDLVEVVDHGQRGVLMDGSLGDHHVVRRRDLPLDRVDELVVGSGRVGEVAREDQRHPGVATVEVLDVLVAGESADEGIVDERLQVGVDLVAILVREVGRLVRDLALPFEDEPDHRERVLVAGQHRDLARELRQEHLLGRGQILTGADPVVAHAIGEGLVGVVVGLIGVPCRALQPLDEVGDRGRHLGRVDRLDPLAVDQPSRHVVGDGDQVPAGVEASLQLRRDGGDEVLVALDRLLVVDLRARLGGVVRQGRGRRAILGPVHVARPVGPIQRAFHGPAGPTAGGRASAASRARAADRAGASARARPAATGRQECAGASHGRCLEHRPAAQRSGQGLHQRLVSHRGASKLRRAPEGYVVSSSWVGGSPPSTTNV